MTSYKTITGPWEQIEDLFENSKVLSIRYYNKIAPNTWDVIIRHHDSNGLEEKVRRAKTVLTLKKIDEEFSKLLSD